LFYVDYLKTPVLAFLAIKHNDKNAAATRIYTINILPESQGKGTSTLSINCIQKLA
jgi:hypothetical protein